MKSRVFTLSGLLVFLITSVASAGDRSDIRGVGMGRTIEAASRTTDAIGINPASIALPDIGRFTLSLAPFGAMMSTELFTYNTYHEYFTGVPGSGGKRDPRLLTPEEASGILSGMPELPATKIGMEWMIFGMTYQHPSVGGIGFAMIEHAGAAVSMSKDFFRMAVFGLDSAGSQYNFQGTDVAAWWYMEYNLSYGVKLPFKPNFLKDLYAGIGLKLLHGYGVDQTVRQNSSFGNYLEDANQYSLKGNSDFLNRRAGVDLFQENSGAPFTPFPEPVGKGFGMDLGFSSEIISGLRAAMSVTDIGSITWNKNVFESIGGGPLNVNGILGDLQDTLKNVVNGKTLPGASFTTSLPTILRLGATMETYRFPFFRFLPGRMLLAFDYTQGLNKSLGNTTKPRFSLGAEYRIIPFVPIRTGLSIGGDDRVRWAFGAGASFRYCTFDISTDHFGMLFMPKSFQMVSISMGMKVRM